MAITFKNDQSFAVQPVLQSTILAAGLGIFVTDQLLDPSDPSITGTSCESSQIVNCGEVTRTLNPGADTIGSFGFMSAGFDFDVSVGGTSVYSLAGDISSDVAGFTTNFNGADAILNGFGLTSSPGSLWARSYAWQDTVVDIVIPGLLQPGESVTAIYTITTTSFLKGSCSQQSLVSGEAVTVCPIAFSSFGDPIRSGGTINNPSQLAPGSFLTANGLIDGLTFDAIGRFKLPTEHIDPLTGRMTAILPGVTIFPDDGPTVPEPASWALMIAGFGMVGSALRRRRALIA
ncbi:MAG: PEPxxWA-CTERM sorting domain-containing protein [Polymorphobacter sp.]